MKIAFVAGTRPEFIKLSPLINLCNKKKIKSFIVHSGQHYSHNMNKIFFKELQISKPKYFLNIKSKSALMESEHTGRMMISLEPILLKEIPNYVIVHGDTNTTLAGSLVATKISIKKNLKNNYLKLVHVESGLRSFDKYMPEEINRIISDQVSDILLTPTNLTKKNLLNENIDKKKIFVTGNTIVDVVKNNIKILKKKKKFNIEGIKDKNYILVTLHRPETVDNIIRLKKLINTFDKLIKIHKLPIIWPVHPRTKKNLNKFFKSKKSKIKLINPLGYFNFLALQKNAKLILTDSGGVQEEACILKVPCVTLRNSTERPETVQIKSNIVSGYKEKIILENVKKMLFKKISWNNPFGDGNISHKILRVLKKELKNKKK
jgi:UDP-N-acetylglucosamine 2-epimerase (non-hydrolysing)